MPPDAARAQTSAAGPAAREAVPGIVHAELRRPGDRLEPPVRRAMEHRFGHDFSQVRVHADDHAARSTSAVGAPAFTAGADVVVHPAHWRHGSPARDALLAHELAHVVQQAGAAPAPPLRFSTPAAEADADAPVPRPAPYSVARAEPRVPATIPAGRRAIIQWGNDPATVANAEALRTGLRGGPNAAGSGTLIHAAELGEGKLTEVREVAVVIHGAPTSTPAVRPGEQAPRADVGIPGQQRGQLGPVEQVSPEQMARGLVSAGFGGGRWTYYRVRLVMCYAGVGEEESYASRLNASLAGEGVRAEVMGGTGAVSATGRLGTEVMPETRASARPQPGVPQVEEAYQPGMSWPMRRPGSGWQRVPPPSGGAAPALPDVPAAPPSPAVTTAPAVPAAPARPTPVTGGTRAYLGERDMTPVSTGGPDPRGVALANGAVLALQGINFVLGVINDKIQRERFEAEMALLRPVIEDARRRQPHHGVLMTVHYTLTESLPDSPIKAGPQFARIEWGVGRNPREARANIAEQPRLLPGLLPTQSEAVTQQLWVPPLEPVEVAPPNPPLPVAGLGTFASRTPVLQDVEWSNMGGFDDEGTSPLTVPAGMQPVFHLLQIPDTVASVIPRREDPEIKRQRVPTAVRNGFPVVRLDPWMPFSDVAAVALFPADNPTLELFGQTPPTVQFGPLLIANFDLIRWARPEQLRRLS